MVDGGVEEMKNSVDICYAANVIVNVQHTKPSKAKLCDFLESWMRKWVCH